MRPPALHILSIIIVLVNTLLPIVEGCSSRSTPKPRPTPLSPTTARPNVTFHTYPCPESYDSYFCLNGATCFMVKIGESVLYNCECSEGYMGQRCEFKDLEGSYVSTRQKVMLETASIASGATLAVFLVVVICIIVYMHRHRRHKATAEISVVDHALDVERRGPFSKRDVHQIPLRHLHSIESREHPRTKMGQGDHQYATTSLYASEHRSDAHRHQQSVQQPQHSLKLEQLHNPP